jgi:hypothetical protein
MQLKLMRIRPFALPLALIVLGIGLLIGCIPIPATRQLQPDWRPRPETAVGQGSDKPIQPGRTSIADAFIAISARIGMETRRGTETRTRKDWSILRWLVSDDGRRFAAGYQIRTSTLFYPLCFHSEKRTADRWLVLDVNDQGIVTSTSTVVEHPAMDPLTPERCLEVFDESTRQKLQSAGVLPGDDILRRAAEAHRRQNRPVPSPRPE